MEKIKSQLESLLFVAAKPIAVKQLAELLEIEEAAVKEAADALSADYKNEGRGLQLTANAGKYQLVSSPDSAAVIQKFIQEETSGELSRPSLEALTIIAYRSPVTKSDLDKIRGVNCALILRNLLVRGLIETKEEKSLSYYDVTLDFLRFLGLNAVTDLPDYERLHNLAVVDKVTQEEINS